MLRLSPGTSEAPDLDPTDCSLQLSFEDTDEGDGSCAEGGGEEASDAGTEDAGDDEGLTPPHWLAFTVSPAYVTGWRHFFIFIRGHTMPVTSGRYWAMPRGATAFSSRGVQGPGSPNRSGPVLMVNGVPKNKLFACFENDLAI